MIYFVTGYYRGSMYVSDIRTFTEDKYDDAVIYAKALRDRCDVRFYKTYENKAPMPVKEKDWNK